MAVDWDKFDGDSRWVKLTVDVPTELTLAEPKAIEKNSFGKAALEFAVLMVNGKEVTDKQIQITSARFRRKIRPIVDEAGDEPFTIKVTRRGAGTDTDYDVEHVVLEE